MCVKERRERNGERKRESKSKGDGVCVEERDREKKTKGDIVCMFEREKNRVKVRERDGVRKRKKESERERDEGKEIGLVNSLLVALTSHD